MEDASFLQIHQDIDQLLDDVHDIFFFDELVHLLVLYDFIAKVVENVLSYDLQFASGATKSAGVYFGAQVYFLQIRMV